MAYSHIRDDKACTVLLGSNANSNIRDAMTQRATFCLLSLM